MRSLALAIGLAFFSLSASAQDLLQGANQDVLNAFFFSGRSELRMTVTRELPPGMSGYQLPDGFQLIGSAARQGGLGGVVALKTSLPTDRALAVLIASMRADGWAEEDDGVGQPTFNLVGAPVSRTVCSDGRRRYVSVQEIGGTHYVQIIDNQERRDGPCGERRTGMEAAETLRRSLPRFTFPDTARTAPGAMGGGSSGSNDSISTTTRINSPDPAASLSEHLGAQLQAQGWRRDASWSGSLSSGSVWRGQVQEMAAWAALEIVGLGADLHEVRFTMGTQPR